MNRNRAGKTLIEMLVIMVGLSAVLVTAGQLLYRLSQLERTVRNTTAVSRAELRLTRDVRRDVRQSATATLRQADSGDVLRLDGPDGTIEYTAAGDFVRRIESGTTHQRHEQYRVGNVTFRMAIEANRFVVLSSEPDRQDGSQTTSAGPFRIVAAIGGDGGRSSGDPSPTPPVEAPKPAVEVSP